MDEVFSLSVPGEISNEDGQKIVSKGCTSTLSYQRVFPVALRTAKVDLPDAPLRHTLDR